MNMLINLGVIGQVMKLGKLNMIMLLKISPNPKDQNNDSPVAPLRQRKPRKTWSVQEHK